MKKLMLFLLLSPLVLAIPVHSAVWWTGTPDFVINETSHFDAGFKANNSDGNYNIETYTDNLNISEDTFELSSKYSDRFTYDHDWASSDPWKWYVYDDELFDYDIYTHDGVLTVNITEEGSGYQWYTATLDDVLIDGDFDVIINFSDLDVGCANAGSWTGIALTDDPIFGGSWGVNLIVEFDGAGNQYYTLADWGAVNTQVATTDTSGRLRMTRDGQNVKGYYWNHTSSDWVLIDTSNDANNDADMYMLIVTDYWNCGVGDTHHIDWSDFVISSGTLVNDGVGAGTPYKTTGNWTSAAQTIPAGKHLENITFNFSMEDSGNYLDFINLTNSTGDTFYYYDGDMLCSSGCLFTINRGDEADEFSQDVTGSFGVILGLKSTYGNVTPTLNNIIGYYETPIYTTRYLVAKRVLW